MRRTSLGFLICLATACAVLVSPSAHADVSVHGYTKKDGTYVGPYHRSDPDGRKDNNYSHHR